MKTPCLAVLSCALLLGGSVALAQASADYSVVEPSAATAVRVFEARAGESMRVVLLRWSMQAGWAAPSWKTAAAVDFAVGTTMRLEAAYPVAVRTFVGAVRGAKLSVQLNDGSRTTTLQVAP